MNRYPLARRAPLLLSLAALTLGAPPAAAQTELPYRRTLGQPRHAGIYHAATGTWTRGGSGANLATDAIYRNDAPAGYFGVGWEGCWSVEEARLPGPTAPELGPQDAYAIEGFDFAYCKLGSGTIDWAFGYYSSYSPCDDPTSPNGCVVQEPQYVLVPGLPGGSACWTVTVDLTGGAEVCLAADGGACAPGYQGGVGFGSEDTLGLAFGWLTSDGATAGPLLAGDPQWIPRGDGTCYSPGFSNACGAAVSTGLGTWDSFATVEEAYDPFSMGFDACAIYGGCHWFGGYTNALGCGGQSNVPMASFPFVLYADCAQTCEPGSVEVYCDETQNPSNAADIGIDTVSTSVSEIWVRLEAGPPGQFCYLLVGDGNATISAPPGAVGDLCVTGGVCLGRYDKDVGPIGSGGTFQTNILAPLSNPCAGGVSIFPGSTWNFQYWHRQPMGQLATFSSALHVEFH